MVCLSRLSSINFTWFILEYFVPFVSSNKKLFMITQPFATGIREYHRLLWTIFSIKYISMPTKVMTYLSWKTFFKNMLKESVENWTLYRVTATFFDRLSLVKTYIYICRFQLRQTVKFKKRRNPFWQFIADVC